MKNCVKEKENGHTYVQWLITMLANITLLTYGMQAGWVSPMTKVLQSDSSPTGHPLSDYEISWIASVLPFSAVFGVQLFSYLVDAYGRKAAVILMVILQTICWIIKLCATSATALIVSRIFCGFASGPCYNIVPMYVREISEDKIRGKLGSAFIMVQNSGFFAMYAMGAFLDYNLVLWIVTSISVVSVLVMLTIPESPAYLVKREKFDEAAITISRLRGLDKDHKLIQTEMEALKNSEERFKALPNISFMSIFRNPKWRRGFFLLVALVMSQSFSGNFAILSYSSTILRSSGVTIRPELQILAVPSFMIIGTFISMHLVERFGRKILLAVSYMIDMLAMISLGTIMWIQYAGGTVPSWVAIVSMAVYSVAYGAGVSPLPYVVMSEMFNFQIRARLMGCLVAIAWFTSFMQLVSFTLITKTLGPHIIFYCYAAMNLFGAAVSLLFLPETKGKTVDEIEQELGGNKN